MTTYQFFTTAWTWNSILLLLSALAFVGYLLAFRQRGRPVYFAAALVLFLLAFISPLSALANGYLFSAHMLQHILLVLIIPALLLLSLPRSFSLRPPLTYLSHPLIGWGAGVGAMWLWHAPTLCNAAATSRTVSAIQTTSLLIMGSVFWWQVLAPREEQRLSPPAGIVYLFTACTACSVLGIILTYRRTADVGSYVCDLCDGNSRPARSLAFITTTGGIKCLTNSYPRNIPTPYRLAGRCYPIRHCRTQLTSRPG